MKTDVSNIDEVRLAFEETITKFGTIDIIVNSAGIAKDSKWDEEIAVNVVS